MKKIIITYGLIGGIIVSVLLVTTMPLSDQGIINFDNGMFIGYATMILALSTVFFGVKTYRDQHLNGRISFWSAFKVGILITSVACLMYAITWEVYYNAAASDFMQKYTAHYLDKLQKEGISTEQLAAEKQRMEEMSEMYKNPLIRFAFTLMEIIPVGLLITLITAGLLRKRETHPTSPAI